MSDQTASGFSDDNPKSNPWTEDQLGFTPFAKRLAASIIEVDAPNGYVIGLQGAWGSGKSTALNFVQAIINEHNIKEKKQNKITVIDFRPWIVSGHQDLIEAFFKIITEQVADRKDAWLKRTKTGLRALRKNVDPLVDATAAVGSILAPGIGSIGGIGAKLATEAAKKASASKLDEWLSEPSLQSAYEKLRKRMGQQDDKFLVIIDDIDRLTQSEIRTIMQMVKTLGRLPNVVYLLAYDRNIVWPALVDGLGKEDNGPNFAEKIIQQEIELPKPSRADLLAMLDAEIGFLTAHTEQNERWYNIVVHGIQRWIIYPRDVARLSNAVKFTWPAIEGEVDPQDVLAMEGVRLFEPTLFEWMREHRDHIFGASSWEMASENGRAKAGQEFLALFPEAKQESITRLFSTLVPGMNKIFDGKSIYGLSTEAYYKVANRRGVGSEAGYNAYFSLHPSNNAVSKRILDKVFTKELDREAHAKIIKEFISRKGNSNTPLVGEYFQELRYRIIDSPSVPISLFEAIFDLGDEIHNLNDEAMAFMLPASMNASFLLRDICKSIDRNVKFDTLNRMFEQGSSISFLADFWVWRARELKLISDEVAFNDPVIDEKLLLQLHSKLLMRILNSVKDGSIHDAPFLSDIFKAWAFKSDVTEIRDWISSNSLENAQFLSKICRGLLAYTVGSKPRRYSMRSIPNEPYLELDKLRNAAGIHKDDQTLTDDERAMIIAVFEGLTTYKNRSGAKRNTAPSDELEEDEDDA